MAEAGYIKLYRKTEEDELYFKEPFTKWQAWCDLLLLALWKDRQFIIRGIIVDGKRGNVYCSLSKLASRWMWDKKKVMRFIQLCEKLGKVTLQKSNVVNAITICNYEYYQSNTDTNDTTNNTTNDTANNTANDTTIEEYKEYNNISTSTAPAREEPSLSSSALSSPPCHGGATPSQTSALQKSPLLLSQLKSSTPWHESLCMRFHIPRDALLAHIDSFAADMRDRDKDIGTDLSDAKNHFINWYMIQQRKNKDDTNQQKSRNKRRGIETGDTQSKNYHSSF